MGGQKAQIASLEEILVAADGIPQLQAPASTEVSVLLERFPLVSALLGEHQTTMDIMQQLATNLCLQKNELSNEVECPVRLFCPYVTCHAFPQDISSNFSEDRGH